MSLLEALLVELFRDMAGYLEFLDKKALSIASKTCHAKTGNFKCPDQLTWFIHLCRFPPELQSPLIQDPQAFRFLIFDVLTHVICGGVICLKVDMRGLTSRYFPKSFPESTLIYYYSTVARDFAKSVIELLDVPRSDAASRVSRDFWGGIQSDTIEIIEWLDQRPAYMAQIRFKQRQYN